ncbi:MAG TPA: serine hydrolase [Vicinamibacteria bacterium]|nr:serine hydrolase [Vicinamibacteria bacterium]
MKHLCLFLVLAGTASADESTEVRRSVEHFLDLLGGLRHYALEQYFTPDANVTTARSTADGFVHRTVNAREWLEELREAPDYRPFREVLSNVEVRVEDSALAFVRADFEIVRDERVVSSGVDYFTLVRRDGTWKIASIAYTSIPSAPASEPESPLTRELKGMLDALEAKSSLYAKHLPSGREIAIRADEPMNTLSVIKVPILVLAYRDHDAGQLGLDERYLVRPEDRRRGSGLLQTFAPGLTPTYRDLATQMIVTSDNTATDILIEKVGLERVNVLLADRGYETRLLRTTGELFRQVWVLLDPKNASLSHAQVFEKGFPSDEGAFERSFAFEGNSDEWLGRTTARETGRLLEQLLAGELASRESSDEMIAILKRQFYASRLPRHLPRGIEVAHKTGDWPPIAGNDVGILFHPGGPTVVSVYVNQNRGDFVQVEETIGEIARKLVEAWGE